MQQTRLTCLERLGAANTTKQTYALLQDALMISLFSVTPPDVSANAPHPLPTLTRPDPSLPYSPLPQARGRHSST